MMTSDKNVGKKFNIKKMSALRQITLLMRNDYHRCPGAGMLIKKTALPGAFRMILHHAAASSGPEFIV